MVKKLIPLLIIFLFLGCDRGPIIEDFKIEGVGLGDSLLDVMTNDEILEQISNPVVSYDNFTPPNLFYEIYTTNNLETYDTLSFFIYPDDENYQIYGIWGELENSSLENCFTEQEQINQQFKEMFPQAEYFDAGTYEMIFHEGAFMTEEQFYMPDGETLMIQCVDVRNDKWSGDNDLLISIQKPELEIWLSGQ